MEGDGDDNGFSLGPTWVAGKTGTMNIRKKGEYPTAPHKLYAQVQNGVVRFTSVSTQGSVSYSIPTVGSVGYDVSESGVEKKPGYRYGDSMGAEQDDNFEASEMMDAANEQGASVKKRDEVHCVLCAVLFYAEVLRC